ncbi:MAG: hypothetical protein ACLTUA_10310 [Bifidobacterium pseudocatenulatum]
MCRLPVQLVALWPDGIVQVGVNMMIAPAGSAVRPHSENVRVASASYGGA